jgi:hypothetical protein
VPVTRLLNQGQVSKVAVGWDLEVDLAQQAVASIKDAQGIPKTPTEFKPIAERIEDYLRSAFVLWVDDKNPSQNVQERRVLEAFGIHFDLASSSE